MNRHAGTALLIALASAACQNGGTAPPPDGGSFSRTVGNCVMTPSLCPSRYCISRNGTFECACVDVPAGQTCEPCPPGYRYHSKYSSCEPTCAVRTCPAGQACFEDLGVAMCMPSDAGASDGPATTAVADATPPAAAKCTCEGGCRAGEKCLHNRPGSIGPTGRLECGAMGQGLAECRLDCSLGTPCPASRPHCRFIPILGGCCTDGVASANVCCANADATTVDDCR
jgi:hypothetical protein